MTDYYISTRMYTAINDQITKCIDLGILKQRYNKNNNKLYYFLEKNSGIEVSSILLLTILKYLGLKQQKFNENKYTPRYILDRSLNGKNTTKNTTIEKLNDEKQFILGIYHKYDITNPNSPLSKKLNIIIDIIEQIYNRMEQSSKCKNIYSKNKNKVHHCIENRTTITQIKKFNREECKEGIKELCNKIQKHRSFQSVKFNSQSIDYKNVIPENVGNIPTISQNTQTNTLMNENTTPPQLNNKYKSFRQSIEHLKTLNKNSDEYKSLIIKIRNSIKENPQLNSIVRSEINKLRKECKNRNVLPSFETTCSPNISLLQSILPKNEEVNNTQNVKQVIKKRSFLSKLNPFLRQSRSQ